MPYKYFSIAIIAILVSIGSITAWKISSGKAVASPASNPLSELTTAERILRSRGQLKELTRNPYGETRVLVSLKRFEQKEIALEFEERYGIKILQIIHAHIAPNSIARGGFFVGENETLTTEDLVNFESQKKSEMRMLIEDLKRMLKRDTESLAQNPYQPVIRELGEFDRAKNQKIGTKADVEINYVENIEGKQAVEAANNSLADMEHRLAALEKSGLQIFGFEIKAQNKQILELSKNSAIRMIEIPNKFSKVENKTLPVLPTE